MKKLCVMLLLTVCLCGLFVGCGTLDSPSERYNRYGRISRTNARQLVDDWDYFWLMDRSSRMTEWHPRVTK